MRRSENKPLWKTLLRGRSDLSWAGPSWNAKGFCFGTEDGLVFWTDIEGRPLHGHKPLQTPHRGEAVNGVAIQPTWMVVTTRAGSSCWKLSSASRDTLAHADISFGAHMALRGNDNNFILPTGRQGLIDIQKGDLYSASTTQILVKSKDINFYRAAVCNHRRAHQVIGCAARKTGIAVAFHQKGAASSLKLLTSETEDFVDICTYQYPDRSLITQVLSKSGKIFVFKDILSDQQPTVYSNDINPGNAYRILNAIDLFLVLYANKLHVIDKIFHDAPNDHDSNITIRYMPIELEAVDMNLVGDRWLLIRNRSRGKRPCFQGFGEAMRAFGGPKWPLLPAKPLIFQQFTP